MKVFLFAVALAVFAASSAAESRFGPPPAGMPPEVHAQRHAELDAVMDCLSADVREMEEGLAQRQVRPEYQRINRAQRQQVDCLRTLEQRMEALQNEREFRNNRARLAEMDRFQDRMRVLALGMEESQAALRRLSFADDAAGSAAPQEEQARVMEQHRMIRQRLQDLGTHCTGLNAWLVEKGARKELLETGQDLEHYREQLRLTHRELDLIHAEGPTSRDRMRDLDRMQDRMRSQLREMEEAHESLTRLVGAP